MILRVLRNYERRKWQFLITFSTESNHFRRQVDILDFVVVGEDTVHFLHQGRQVDILDFVVG